MDNGKQNHKTNIMTKVGVASCIGLTSGAAVSPFIAMVDRAIIENISGKNSQWASLGKSIRQFASGPLSFVARKKEVRWVWFVYGNTYLAANSTDIVCK